MNKKDVVIGMKVVPFQKTAYGFEGLEKSFAWKWAIEANRPYLNVDSWSEINCCWILDGDLFNSCDFEPYIDEVKIEVKGRLERVNSGEVLGAIGTKTPLLDINGKQLFIGDVVGFKDNDVEDSIVCTKKGDIMGIFGTVQDTIARHGIQKLKSYEELKDEEVYRGCVKIVLDKEEEKPNYLQNEYHINHEATYSIVFKSLRDIIYKTPLRECKLNKLVGIIDNFCPNEGMIAVTTEDGLQIIHSTQLVEMLVVKED